MQIRPGLQSQPRQQEPKISQISSEEVGEDVDDEEEDEEEMATRPMDRKKDSRYHKDKGGRH